MCCSSSGGRSRTVIGSRATAPCAGAGAGAPHTAQGGQGLCTAMSDNALAAPVGCTIDIPLPWELADAGFSLDLPHSRAPLRREPILPQTTLEDLLHSRVSPPNPFQVWGSENTNKGARAHNIITFPPISPSAHVQLHTHTHTHTQ